MKSVSTIDDPRYVKALAHPLRVRILAVLEERTASPIQLAGLFDADIGVVSYHVRTLAKLGLIRLVGKTRRRGAFEHHYRAHERPTVSDEAWAQASPIAKQALAGSNLELIHELVTRSAAAGGFDRGDAHMSRTGMRLDRRGWEAAARACEELLGQLDEIEREAHSRMREDADEPEAIDIGAVIMLFEATGFSANLPTGRDARTHRPRRRSAQQHSEHA